MNQALVQFFEEHFVALTRKAPYPWQRALFLQIADPAGIWPEVLDLPTGAGKTSVLYVWLLALAYSVRAGTFHVPRRLAWVVNRRVVVDQITEEVTRLVDDPGGNSGLDRCPEVRELLANLSATEPEKPLAVSTLRGQFADNGDWSKDPSKPAVVVGTVDMIGSRLLFRGYGIRSYHRPIHAGLLGTDALIVNDEAHLSPAFASLLRSVHSLPQPKEVCKERFRFLLLSATPTSDSEDLPPLRRLEHNPAVVDAAESERFGRVFTAPKSLTLVRNANTKALEAERWKLATQHEGPRTLVFVDQPEKAAEFAVRLRKEGHACELMTGTMRGLERDLLAKSALFQRFLTDDPGSGRVFLVATSAAEVGVNLTCERLITDLREADSLLQRFGRLNRFGAETPGEAFVLWKDPLDKTPRLLEALRYLETLNGDISCRNLWYHKPPAEACRPQPVLARLDPRLPDLWAQTTYHDSEVPAVASWLHGKQDDEVPETAVVWRADFETLLDWQVEPEQIEEVLEAFPVQTWEQIREPSSRVQKKLAEIHEQRTAACAPDCYVILRASDGSCQKRKLSDLADARDDVELRYVTLVLPDGVGALDFGMWWTDATSKGLDVAESGPDGAAGRFRFRLEGGRLTASLATAPGVDTEEAVEAVVEEGTPEGIEAKQLAAFAEKHKLKPAYVVWHPRDEDRSKAMVYFEARSGVARASAQVNIPLASHVASVGKQARAFAAGVGLTGSLQDAFALAGEWHDSGKDCDCWQRAMGGSMDAPLAKTKAPVNLRLINKYRHELGSLVDLLQHPPAGLDDVALHLIGVHHAGGRPYFRDEQYDREHLADSAQAAAEAALRFGRMQLRFGHWGLAYLDAVFKCADGFVSATEGDAASA